MLSGIEQAKQKWGGAHNAIDNWLTERQMLLVMYCDLAGIPPYQRTSQALPDKSKVADFCELLMDYLSAGHFEVYEQLSNGDSLYDTLSPKISATTDEALKFNDRYAEINDDTNMSDFDNHLSKLGQQLEERFALEDELIGTLHNEHL
ncbi:sigma D regulator [Neptunicella sp.]|uniref:sigma D regulator n=1 Tax=Neptunicella sp. TaxID=2125986 RepID=UPI003F68EB2E